MQARLAATKARLAKLKAERAAAQEKDNAAAVASGSASATPRSRAASIGRDMRTTSGTNGTPMRPKSNLSIASAVSTPTAAHTPSAATPAAAATPADGAAMMTPMQKLAAKRARLAQLKANRYALNTPAKGLSTPGGASLSYPATPGLATPGNATSTSAAAHAELQQELAAKAKAVDTMTADNAALVAKVASLEEAATIAAVHAEGKDAIIASLESTGDGSKEVVELTGKLHKLKVASAMQLAASREQTRLAEDERKKAEAMHDDVQYRYDTLQGGLTGYWQTLLEEGADLNQITEELQLQNEAVEEYEMLLGEMTGELEELRVQTKFLRESELSQENLMQEYEGENQRLLDELDDIRALHSERKSPETALEDLPDAMTADMLAKAARVAEKTAAEAVARAEAAEERCATATKDAADVKELAHALERDLEEVGEQLREETEGKEAAIADLHNVVDEITAEEERLLDEIELLKSVDSNRVITFRRTERELKLELETAQEEKDALATELEEIRRSRTATEGSPRRGLGDSTRDGDGGSGDGDLQSELAALNQQVPTEGDTTAPFMEEIATLKAGQQRMAKETKTLKTKIKDLNMDLDEKSTLLDAVIAKWTASVKQFIQPADDPLRPARPQHDDHSRTSSPALDGMGGDGAVPTKKEEQAGAQAPKKRRGKIWSKFLPKRQQKEKGGQRMAPPAHPHPQQLERQKQQAQNMSKSPPGGTRYTVAGRTGTAKRQSLTPSINRAGTVVELDRSEGKTLGMRLGDAPPYHGVPIHCVFDGGQSIGKLNIGDVILKINGVDVLGFTSKDASMIIKRSNKVELTLGEQTDDLAAYAAK